MNAHPTREYGILREFFSTLWKHGPLGTAKTVNRYMIKNFGGVPGFNRLFLPIDRLLSVVQRHLDSSFDRKYGVDTSGVISLEDLAIESKNVKEFLWYEPMSVNVFHQIMSHLDIDFSKFLFIDFGSGKGRVLLLAADYGYRKIIGVEISRELHLIAEDNVAIYNRYKQKPSNIETLCMDAVEFPVPNVPVVIFFYTPFIGKVLEQVLNNVSTSYDRHPREIVLIFYGSNPEPIKLLGETQFQWRELELKADWSQFIKYRCFLSTGYERNQGRQ